MTEERSPLLAAVGFLCITVIILLALTAFQAVQIYQLQHENEVIFNSLATVYKELFGVNDMMTMNDYLESKGIKIDI